MYDHVEAVRADDTAGVERDDTALEEAERIERVPLKWLVRVRKHAHIGG